MNFHSAQKQFKENASLFGNPRTDPEKYNLYNGLTNIADGLNSLEGELQEVKRLLVIIVNQR